jgi:hypothetical protein
VTDTRMTSLDVHLRAIDVFSAAVEAPSQDEAVAAVNQVLADLVDADELRRVAACLAVQAVRAMPPRKGRLPLLRRWLVGYRLEVSWVGSDVGDR